MSNVERPIGLSDEVREHIEKQHGNAGVYLYVCTHGTAAMAFCRGCGNYMYSMFSQEHDLCEHAEYVIQLLRKEMNPDG